MPRGQGWPSPGRRQLTIRFGEPLRPREGESVREFAPRIKDAVATLLDEDRTTWWEARRRAASGATPDPVRPGGRPVAAGVGAVGVALGRGAGPSAAGLGSRNPLRVLSPLGSCLAHDGRSLCPHEENPHHPGRPAHRRAARPRRAGTRLRTEVTTTGSSRPAAVPPAPTGSSRSRPTTAASRSRARSTPTSPARAGSGRSRTTAPSRRRARPPPAAAAVRSASSARSRTRPAPTRSPSGRSTTVRSAPAPSRSDPGEVRRGRESPAIWTRAISHPPGAPTTTRVRHPA